MQQACWIHWQPNGAHSCPNSDPKLPSLWTEPAASWPAWPHKARTAAPAVFFLHPPHLGDLLLPVVFCLCLTTYISRHAGSHSAVPAAAVKAPQSVEAVEFQDQSSTPPGWQLEEPDHSSPPRYVGISIGFFFFFFVPTEEVFVKQSSFTTTVFVTLLQLNTPHGNLSVQCHLLLASRATGVVTSTIWNVSCLVHSQSRFLVKCCYLIFTAPAFTLPDRSTLDHLKTPRELAWAHLIQCLWYWFQWALMTYQMFLLMDEILIKL